MCGIAGYHAVDGFDLDRALDQIAHRGPDGRGIVHAGDTVHGHVRLSLLDPTPASDQPFRLAGGEVLSYNGELWNYRELRDELIGLGERFTTSGDTEVVAKALRRWGIPEALRHFNGMFALCWTDAGRNSILAVDRHRKIPLYYQALRGGTLWASERRSLPALANARALQPGTIMALETRREQRYALPCSEQLDYAHDIDAGAGELLDRLKRAVQQRLDADAPVCCLVSGGLDSSLILAIAAEQTSDVVAYTAVFDPGSPDLDAARRLCGELGVELFEVDVGSMTLQSVKRAIQAIEIPSKAQIEIAMLCLPLAQRIAADGFKACLSGEAADELFCGYGNMIIQASKAGTEAHYRALLDAALAKMARGNFVRCNKAFMAHGIECRLPYMSDEVVSLSRSMKRRGNPPNKMLLKAAARGTLPNWLINRRKETFQGASGVSAHIAALTASPIKTYNRITRSLYGGIPNE